VTIPRAPISVDVLEDSKDLTVKMVNVNDAIQ